MNPIRLGLIGCGGMGRNHAPKLAAMADIELVGVCDLIEERAAGIGEQLSVPWYLDYTQLLDRVDAVWVCTEPFNRRAIVLDAANRGKDIFTEKPIALDLDEADAMIAAAEQAGVVYMLGYCLRFRDPYRLMHDTLASGELGELVNCWTRRYMPSDMSARWYGKQELSGGVLLDFGSHDIDWLRWMGGDAEAVFGAVRRVRPAMQADEHAQALLTFADGGMGTCDISWSAALRESSIGVVGTKGAVIVDRSQQIRKQIDGQEEVILDQEAAMSVDPAGNVGQADASGRIQAVLQTGESMYEHFVRCIRERLQPVTAAADGRKTLATVRAMQQSAKTGCSVNVNEMQHNR